MESNRMAGLSRVVPILAFLALAGCETTNSTNWAGGSLGKFSDAEQTCEDQSGHIEEEGDRPQFFVACMAALGWTPEPGSRFANAADAPDPT